MMDWQKIDLLREALRELVDDNEDYIKINNLGKATLNNQVLVRARAALMVTERDA